MLVKQRPYLLPGQKIAFEHFDDWHNSESDEEESSESENETKPDINDPPQLMTAPAVRWKKAPRFKRTTAAEVNKLFEARQTPSTKKNTTWGCKIFQEWNIERRGEAVDFLTISAEELNQLLEIFYCEARPEKNGAMYQKNTFINLRAAINRRLADLKRSMDIVKGKEFSSSNGVLYGLLKERIRDGTMASTQHRQPITKSDLEKIHAYFKNAPYNPVILRQCVYFHIALHFFTRGQEFYHQLRLDSFTFHTDESGEYAVLNEEAPLQGNKGKVRNTLNCGRRMYATGGETCPLKMLKLLIEKTEETARFLFNKYRTENLCNLIPTIKWFHDAPLSKRTFATFIKDIGKGAKLSKVYTGNCLRLTALENLSEADIEDFEAQRKVFLSEFKERGLLARYNKKITALQKIITATLHPKH